jgi:hypothetical protein
MKGKTDIVDESISIEIVDKNVDVLVFTDSID